MKSPLEKYHIDIDLIKKHIEEASVKKQQDKSLPPETFTKDTLDTYSNFAKSKMGIEFKDVTLFITALTHRSYVNEHRKAEVEHNERLEFLGDAILELVVSDFLFEHFDEPEGIMTAWRSALVRIHLIRLSKGEKLGNSRTHASIIADCFEAVTGAIYLDQGFESAKDFIYQHIITKMDEVILSESWRDAKSYLQELAQKFENSTPQYHVTKEEGPDHDRLFTIDVVVAGHKRGTGTGHSKQEAQSAAASEGIKYYKKQNNTQKMVTGKLSLVK